MAHHEDVDRDDRTAGIRAPDAQDGQREGADGGRERRADDQARLVDDFGAVDLSSGSAGRRPIVRPLLSKALVTDVAHRLRWMRVVTSVTSSPRFVRVTCSPAESRSLCHKRRPPEAADHPRSVRS
jgi:hypothetical protein